ncbi:MAG: ASPIC/UnbV domain-containing protein, partial [Planctomycetota bacterium]
DLIIANNDDAVATLTRATGEKLGRLTLQLKGGLGNPTAIGARASISRASGAEAVEVYAGEGYLTQSPGILRLANSPSDPITGLTIRWPDGSKSVHEVGVDQKQLVVTPDS